MAFQLGSAPDSWGVWFGSDPRQIPWTRFLDEVAVAGYEWIEIGPYGYLPTEVSVLRRELAARNLKVTGSFVNGPLHEAAAWPDIERQTRAMGALLGGVEARFLVLMTDAYHDPYTGKASGPPTLSGKAWRQLIDTTHRLADLARDEYGLRLVFHPHAGMYVETEPEIEALLADTDPRLVSLCLDTGQHLFAGGDPLAFLRRHHTRIPYLHLKDIDAAVLRRVQADQIPINAAVDLGVFTEPAQGMIDFAALFAFLRTIDFDGPAIVEQDMFPAPFDKPLPIAKRSHAYFTALWEQSLYNPPSA
jgi:inosose dehydratase